MAYKVFTNGSVLNASEINDNLMRQSVMVFSNAAARTAAITSPLEGMLTWLEDVNRYESYNGTSWSSPFGLTLLNVTAFTSVTSVVVNNIFSADYANYQVTVQGTATNATQARLRLAASGTPASGSNYNYSGTQTTTASGPSRVGGASQTFGNLGTFGTQTTFINLYVSNPFLASPTSYTFQTSGNTGAENWWDGGSGGHNLSTSYNGIEVYNIGNNITGTIRVYGVKN